MTNGSQIACRWVCLALAALSSFGCGKAEDTMYPVEGEIKFKGQPLSKGTLILRPDVGRGNDTPHQPHGSIDAKGHFKVTTHPHEGAPAGWYKVAVVVTEPSDPRNPYSPPRSLIPERFSNAEESGLSLEVRPNAAPGSYDLELK
jgi:hypothetical protein